MTSRRRRNRSRSPLRDPQHHSGHGGYRERDHYGSDRHNNGRKDRDNRQSSFNDAHGEHYVPDDSYDDSSMDFHRSARPSNDRGRGYDQRGRGRDRGREPRRDRRQSSNSRRNSMPPPAPRPSRANEGKVKLEGAPKNDRPKTIPQAHRDKCGACSQNHDIRYCPYPNTKDGRAKICPICNTAKHAWFECWYYKRDVMEQWTVCWENRRCLPALVHDVPLDAMFHNRVSLAREADNKYVRTPIGNFNSLPGPLSPAFVKKLMPLDVEDAHIQDELQEGRIVPWDLKKEILEYSADRTEIPIRDRSTLDMSIDKFIAGTRSSAQSVPTAIKHRFFHGMNNTVESNDEVYSQILAKEPYTSLKARKTSLEVEVGGPRRTYPEGKWTKHIDLCRICGSDDHETLKCPSPCKACGDSMQKHATTLADGQCKRGCVCRDDAGHKRDDCNRLCRLCMLEKNFNTELKDCKKHCTLHPCLTSEGQHSRCVSNHSACPSCKGRHWHQDCPQWLETLCVRNDCLARQCNSHCHVCGGRTIGGSAPLFAMNDDVADKEQGQALVQALVWKWHHFLHNWQWDRTSAPASDTRQSPWIILRCKRHSNVTADARVLEPKRVGTWEKVVNYVRDGFTKETVSEAVRLLQVPECSACLEQHLHEKAGTWESDKDCP